MSTSTSSVLDELRAVLCEAYGWSLPADSPSIDLSLPEGLPVSISLSPDGQDLVFDAVLRMMVQTQDLALLAAALSLNLHQEATRGGAIGLDGPAGALVYSFRLAADSERPRILGALDGFCHCALDLSAQLQTALDEMPAHEREQLERVAAAVSAAPSSEAEALDDPAAPPAAAPMIRV